jgi:hypothetical protein
MNHPTFLLHFLLVKIFFVFFALNVWLHRFTSHFLPLVHSSLVSFQHACALDFPFGLLFYPENVGNKFLQNIIIPLLGYTASHPRRWQPSFLQNLKLHTNINCLAQSFNSEMKNVHFHVLFTRSVTHVHNRETMFPHLASCPKLLDGFFFMNLVMMRYIIKVLGLIWF